MVAPFDYTAMIWAFLLGYFVFGELPSIYVYVGAAIVVACGLFVLWRERQLRRCRDRRRRRSKARRSSVRDQNALKQMMVWVSWMPAIFCTFSLTKWPMSVA